MKFIHLADLHLGKMLHQFNLIDLQKEILDQVVAYVQNHDIQAVVIAGDIYDRSVPSQEAVNILNDFLNQLINEAHVKVLMISGNHDSNDRLNFASAILESQGLYIETRLKPEMSYVEIADVRFYMLPFFKPLHLKHLVKDINFTTYNEAMAYYLSYQNLDPRYRNILITHQFVGHHSQVSDSEMTLSVGGTDVIDPRLFARFDYVALGHLHAPQSVQRKTIRYAGSLMRYSFSEVHQDKSFTVVDTDDMSLVTIPLIPSLQVTMYRGSYDDFIEHRIVTKNDDLLAIELTDNHLIPHAIDQLRQRYPNVLQLTYPQLLLDKNLHLDHYHEVKNMSYYELFEHFYEDMTDQKLDEASRTIVHELLDEAGGSNEAS